jgi:hypothetical protein
MPIDQIVALLMAERAKLNSAIEALQGAVKRRGRPPKNAASILAAVLPAVPAKRKGMSAARRKAQAERMKAYWAKRKKETAKKS